MHHLFIKARIGAATDRSPQLSSSAIEIRHASGVHKSDGMMDTTRFIFAANKQGCWWTLSDHQKEEVIEEQFALTSCRQYRITFAKCKGNIVRQPELIKLQKAGFLSW